ncbi:hypothetical protein S83_001853 [Arachis hypogaea]
MCSFESFLSAQCIEEPFSADLCDSGVFVYCFLKPLLLENALFVVTGLFLAATKVLARQLVRLMQQIANLQGSRAQMRGIATHIQAFVSSSFTPCRNAIDSSLFKQWLHNLQSEIGILADGTLALRQVLIQVIASLVFKKWI